MFGQITMCMCVFMELFVLAIKIRHRIIKWNMWTSIGYGLVHLCTRWSIKYLMNFGANLVHQISMKSHPLKNYQHQKMHTWQTQKKSFLTLWDQRGWCQAVIFPNCWIQALCEVGSKKASIFQTTIWGHVSKGCNIKLRYPSNLVGHWHLPSWWLSRGMVPRRVTCCWKLIEWGRQMLYIGLRQLGL